MSAAAQEKIETVQGSAEGWSAEEVVRWGLAEFSSHAAIASSFGAEDVALIDIAARVRPDIRVFTLDTDFLFAETYELIDKIEKKYGIRVERVKSLYYAGTAGRPVRRETLDHRSEQVLLAAQSRAAQGEAGLTCRHG